MTTRAACVLLLAAAAFGAGCAQPRFDSPTDAYLSIARALEKRQGKVAWNGLSSDTRTLLEQRAKALSKESGGAVRDDPAALFLGTSYDRPPVKEVKVVRQEGNVATLSVVPEQGPAREVRMVKEADGWKLDATDALVNENEGQK